MLIDTSIRSIATTLITGYQKYISPYKGFSCAHRVLYGSESCSQYVKHIISEENLISALKSAKIRFQACREANQILKVQNQRKRDQECQNCMIDGCPDLAGLGCDSIAECGSLDCSPPEINCNLADCTPDLDCSSCDCASGLDCGSCG
jgi:putative component of membrane protein insertase Oxa1/YidC/SpoIIIJ protein YidD